jgi:hypothetical protein
MRAPMLTAATMCVLFASTPPVVHTRSNQSDDDGRFRKFDLVSRNNAGDRANNDNDRGAISADGRFVAFPPTAASSASSRPTSRSSAAIAMASSRTCSCSTGGATRSNS